MDQKTLIWEGKKVSESELNLGLNRAFRFGDGLFETIRVVNGKPHLWDLHLSRLKAGMKQLKLKADPDFFDILKVEADQLLSHLKIAKGAILRILVYRSGDGKYTPNSNQATRLLSCEEHSSNLFTLNEKGLKVDISQDAELFFHALSPYKTMNALPYVLASQEKLESGFDELLLLNQAENVVEATSSNLFWVRGKQVVTPPITDGALAGVMRMHIIDIVRKMGLEFKEASISVNSLKQADELFLTNSVSAIRWISAFRDKRYFHKLSMELIKQL